MFVDDTSQLNSGGYRSYLYRIWFDNKSIVHHNLLKFC